MDRILPLNQKLEVNSQELESMIAELVEREEFGCTGNYCPVDIVPRG